MTKTLLFNKWDSEEVKVDDPGLAAYINLRPVLVPRSCGRLATRPFHKNDMHIVERIVNKLMIPGHRGKKHKLTSGHCVGQHQKLSLSVKRAFELIEKKTSKNPLQVLVQAIQNSASYEEITGYRLGGIIARKAVLVSPQRRIDLALRYISQGIYRSAFKTKAPLHVVVANELIAVSSNDPKTFAVRERQRLEREAEGAR